MNNTISMNRFGMILKKDLKCYFSKYATFELALLAAYLLYYIIHAIFGNVPINYPDRLKTAILFVMIISFIAPFKLYGDTNDSKLGISYIMLPASVFEKFLSMLLYVVPFTTILFAASIFGLDALLSFIPISNGFEGTFFNADVFSGTNIEFFLSIMLMQSIFFFGNVYFQKHKISKTIFLFISIHIVIMIILIVLFYLFGLNNISFEDARLLINGKEVDDSFSEVLKVLVEIFKYLYMIALPVGLYIASYFKIKTQKY